MFNVMHLNIFILLLAFFSASSAEEPSNPKSDQKIKIKNDELFFTKKPKDMIFDCNSDGLCAIIFDDVAVNLGNTMVNSLREKHGWGKLYWPEDFNRSQYQKYLDSEIEVYCKKTADIRILPSYKCSSCIMSGCTLSSPEYYIKFIN